MFHVSTELGSHSQSEEMNEIVSGLEICILTGIPPNSLSPFMRAHLHVGGGKAHSWKDR